MEYGKARMLGFRTYPAGALRYLILIEAPYAISGAGGITYHPR